MANERPRQEQGAIAGTASDAPFPGYEQLTKDTHFFGHPRGLSTLFMTEMWERFSYYGIRPLLVLFMSATILNGGFGFERSEASAIVGIYAATVYLATLPGGWIADRLLGLQRAILYGAFFISAGQILVGAASYFNARVPFFLGLILIVFGTGLLKPNISAIVGDLYPEGGARRDAGFSIFYMGINIGAFAGQLISGYLGERVAWYWGFAAGGFGMILGLFWFITRRRQTLGEIGMHPSRHPDPVIQAKQERNARLVLFIGLAVLALVFILAAMGMIPLRAQALGKSMTYVLVGTAIVYFAGIFIVGGLDGNEKRRIAVIAVLFVAAAIFWSAFEQAPTSLNLFARDFTDRQFGGFLVPATWFQVINSLFVIVFAPVAGAIWVGLSKTKSGDLSSPAKFSMGLFLAGLGFLVMIFASQHVVASNGAVKVSSMWLVMSYLFQTFGELSLSPVGLSSMTKLSPRRYVGQMMGIWFLAASVGNLIAGLVGGDVDPEKLDQMPRLFTMTTVSLMASALVLLALVIPIRRMMKESGPH